MKETDKAYIAGFFDGKGSIMLLKKNAGKFRTPVISITNTDLDTLEFIKKFYGGCICIQKKYKEHHTQAYVWNISYNKVFDFINDILPYLKHVSKINRCKLLISEYKKLTIRNGKYTEQMAKDKIDFEKRFKLL